MVSIIVPVYNAEKYLSSCIKAIINQTYRDFELLLIDDGSTDKSPYICDRYSKKDSRIKVIHNTNHGVSYTRNCGLKIAKGDYIAFCDADDIYSRNYLKKMVYSAEKNNADIVICNYVWFNEKFSKPVNYRQTGYIKKQDIYKGIFIDNSIGGYSCNKLFRRSILKNIFFNENMQICEDTHFVCNVLNNTDSIFYIKDVLYFYRVHSDSAVSKIENIFTEDGYLKYALVFEQIIKEGIVPESAINYVRAGEFVLAVDTKCNAEIKGAELPEKARKNLIDIIKKNIFIFLNCKEYSLIKKFKCISNYFFNLRKLKNNIKILWRYL